MWGATSCTWTRQRASSPERAPEAAGSCFGLTRQHLPTCSGTESHRSAGWILRPSLPGGNAARLRKSASHSALQIVAEQFNLSGSLNKPPLFPLRCVPERHSRQDWNREGRGPLRGDGSRARAVSSPCPSEGSPRSERATVCNHTSRPDVLEGLG